MLVPSDEQKKLSKMHLVVLALTSSRLQYRKSTRLARRITKDFCEESSQSL